MNGVNDEFRNSRSINVSSVVAGYFTNFLVEKFVPVNVYYYMDLVPRNRKATLLA